MKPAAIVLAFIADDLRRAEMKRVWNAETPSFERVNGARVERNVPVPPPPDLATTLDIWHRLVGSGRYRAAPQGWQSEWSIDHQRVPPCGAGEALACPLMARLAKLHLPALVAAGDDPYSWMDAGYRRGQRRISVLAFDCTAGAEFAGLDLFEATDAAVTAHGYDGLFRNSHPGPLAAAVAARDIAAAALTSRHIPPR
ncbi:MAG: hypothetical protein JSR91_17730 [Proteobacteria bacterium]|nr:hypothetical protein [Pseudomonadota bacterium]